MTDFALSGSLPWTNISPCNMLLGRGHHGANKPGRTGGVTVLQVGRRRWCHGPWGPAGEAGGGGAQQEPADVPAAPRPPAKDEVRLQGEPFCWPGLRLFPGVFFPIDSVKRICFDNNF